MGLVCGLVEKLGRLHMNSQVNFQRGVWTLKSTVLTHGRSQALHDVPELVDWLLLRQANIVDFLHLVVFVVKRLGELLVAKLRQLITVAQVLFLEQ